MAQLQSIFDSFDDDPFDNSFDGLFDDDLFDDDPFEYLFDDDPWDNSFDNPFDDLFDDDPFDNSSIQVVDDLSISDLKTLVNPFDDDDDNSSIQVVDDLYFSALSNENEDQMFPISDSKYAEELQFQEAPMSSVIASKSSVPPLMMIEEKAKAEEVGESSHCFCEICVEKKEADEMFRIDTCSHSFCSDCISKHDLSTIRTVMSGAAPLRKELEDDVRAKFPHAKLGQGYGMTEAGPVLAMCLAFAKEPFEIKSGACGTVVRNAEMKIVDPDTGFSLPRNQPGEICIRGDQIMKGYLNDPEATEGTIDKQGWLYTGDIGYIDDDDELFIVDRLKELIKYKGFQVAPAELEALLLNHPSISDAAVVPMKDESAGEVPVAFVVRTNGFEVTEDEIKKYISKQVVFYKKINRVFFVDAIPKAPSGKILRKDLRARLAAGIPS